MDNDAPPLRWGPEQRIEFIEFRLFWDGSIRRADLTGRFGVSVPQASNDLAQYRALAPDNIRYDSSEKRYLSTPDFQPKLLKPNAERYLAQLKAISEDVIGPEETWIFDTANVGTTPIPARRVESHTLRTFLKAVRERRSISVEYQSLNDLRPDPLWRTISPHAFGNDGLRWHLRAYCHLENKFKDFLLSRCLQLGKLGAAEIDPANDKAWHTYFKVILIPNPKLSTAQQTAIERDYGMKAGRCELKVRHALLYYFDKRLRLDIAETQDRPKETPIVVANRPDYEAALGEVFY